MNADRALSLIAIFYFMSMSATMRRKQSVTAVTLLDHRETTDKTYKKATFNEAAFFSQYNRVTKNQTPPAPSQPP